jgi:hypothetical protein
MQEYGGPCDMLPIAARFTDAADVRLLQTMAIPAVRWSPSSGVA